MARRDSSDEPEWNTTLALEITPEMLLRTLFGSAEDVHTGWGTCVDPSLVLEESSAVDSGSGNHCRLVEQEYSYDGDPEVVWHDWTVEVRVQDVYVSAHWRVPTTDWPIHWDWCAGEAENAFSRACVLIGKRVRRTLTAEGGVVPPPRAQHH